jgi:hypothetical protein
MGAGSAVTSVTTVASLAECESAGGIVGAVAQAFRRSLGEPRQLSYLEADIVVPKRVVAALVQTFYRQRQR